MHPFHQSNELCFKNISSPSDPYQESTIPQQDLIQLGSGQSSPIPLSGHGHDHDHDVTSSTKRMGKRSNIDEINSSSSKKKMMHREIERQRRQEMAARNASLRSLIPHEYIKGKRSISDHMNEAVNYIKHLKNNVSALGAKRDELKNKRRDRGDLVPGHDDEESNICFPCRVMVGPMADGIEILMSSGSVREQDFPLSRVLEIVVREGLDVVNCCSTKVNDRFLQTIQAKVSGICNIDPSGLQEKLTQAVSQSSDFLGHLKYWCGQPSCIAKS